jgi:hypothetical protein
MSWIQRGNIKLFTSHHLMEFEKPSKEQLQQFFSSILKDGKTWRKSQLLFEADLPKLERDTELPKWEKPEEPIDAAQKDRNERNMRGIRMKMREKCEKLYKNRKFKDFQQPVLDNHALPEHVREAYRKCIKHPMDLYSLLREINMQVVRCPAHFRERIKLILDNAYKFNGPDGPVIEASPSKVKSEAESRQADRSGKMYKIPDFQEKVLKDGTILEVSVRDVHTNELEWVPCKISEVHKSCDNQVSSFTVHVIIEREEETGTWNDTYNLGPSLCVYGV